MPSVKVIFKNLNEVHDRMNWVAGKIERGAMRDAANKAAKPMLKASKRHARIIEKTGTLRKSLRRKTKTLVRKNQVVVYIGPDKRVTAEAYGGTHIPANIAHLIEFGFTHFRGGNVEGNHILENAFEESAQETIRIYQREIGFSVDKLIGKFKEKGF